MKLYEIATDVGNNDPQQITDQLIKVWQLGRADFHVNDDLSVIFYCDLKVKSKFLHDGKLPFKLRSALGKLEMPFALRSLQGMPRWCHRDLILNWHNGLFRWEDFLTENILGRLIVHERVDSLVGIDRHLKKVNGIQLDFNKVKEGGIGLVNIHIENKDIQSFAGETLKPQWDIIYKYLNRPDDIFECQAELIENGFEEFAKL